MVKIISTGTDSIAVYEPWVNSPFNRHQTGVNKKKYILLSERSVRKEHVTCYMWTNNEIWLYQTQ